MTSLYYSDDSPSYLKSAILASLAIHITVILVFYKAQSSHSRPTPEIVFSAELIPNPVPPKPIVKPAPSQIVAPPQKSEQPPVEQKQIFESEQDNASIKQQIRRGEDGQASQQKNNLEQQNSKASQISKQVSQEKLKLKEISKPIEAPKEKEIAKADSSNLNLKLKLDSSSLAELAADTAAKKESQTTEEKIQEAIQSAQSENQRSAINLKRSGSQDYLPDIPDGEVTLLNTKANKYAVFVRRVASQVFSNLRGSGWHSLSARDIRAINQDGVFEAILSPKGNLISVKLTTTSESARFDQVLQSAIQKGAKDPNPPNGAEADDGNIHFIFQARSWVQIQPSPRTGAPNERRWLVLGTGLE